MLKIYNSLSRRLEAFRPLSGKTVKLYTCGPTVYSRPHLGNYRTYLFEDALKRYLLYLGYEVRHVMNITDFDNTIVREERKTGMGRKELTGKYERLFRKDMAALGVLPAEKYPHVSDYADQMADRVIGLLKKGMAYRDEKGRVFFDISKYKSYGRLVGKRLSASKGRVAREEYRPGQAGDFLLWDPCRKEEDGSDNCFSSRLGPAHPAWNLHCAVMSEKTLGNRIDVAMGGRDNLFNHHENTRAIIGSLSGREYAKYWMHVRHLIINGEKMSKSKGNAVLLPDMGGGGFAPRMTRFLLLSAHYRKRLDFSREYAQAKKREYEKLRKAIAAIRKAGGKGTAGFGRMLAGAKKGFEHAMDGDMDIPKAVAGVERFAIGCAELAKNRNLSRADAGKALALLKKFDSVLAFLPV